MLAAIFVLLAAELLGELLRSALHVSVPGPVIGMIALAAWLIWRGQNAQPEPSGLARVAEAFLATWVCSSFRQALALSANLPSFGVNGCPSSAALSARQS